MCDPVIFDNVDPKLWALIEAEAKSAKINIVQFSGSVHIDSTDINWNYDGKNTLTVQCTHHVFFVSCKMVNDEIKKLFSSLMEAQSGKI